MKKIFAVLLSVIIVCTFAGSAFASSPYERVTLTSGMVMPYESTTGIFGMDVPSDYTILTLELANSLTAGLETMTEEEFFASFGIDTATAANLLSIATPDILASYDIILAPDLIGNINTAAVPGMGITPDMIGSVGSMLAEQILGQYRNMGVADEDCQYLGIAEYGSYSFIGTYVYYLGSNIYQYVTFTDDGTMIMLTFTEMDLETIESVLETFVIY